MKTFVFFADTPSKRRSDTMNTVVATGADEAAARNEAAQLIGAGVASFKAIELIGDTPAFTVEGGWPVSFWGQSVFPQHTRGGNKMRARPNVG